MKRPTAEYVQWLVDNGFSQEDERLILRTVTNRMILWALLSCIPGVGYFTLPLLILAWSMRKIVKNRSFDHHPGLLFSLASLAMYITFIMVIPLVIWLLAKKFNWGTGIRGLIKKGKIGNSGSEFADQQIHPDRQDSNRSTQNPLIWILIAAAIILIAVLVILLFKPSQSVEQPETTTISNEITVPDFLQMKEKERISAWAIENDIVLEFSYVDGKGKEYTSDPGGVIRGVIAQQPEAGKTLPPGSTVRVTLQVELPPTLQELLIGSWHNCKFDLLTLKLEEITFREDGTFDTYGMGYLPVEAGGELYLYGRYWSGAMGASEESGTYSWAGDNLVLQYQYYDNDLGENISYQQTFKVDIDEDTLTFTYLEGDRAPRQDVIVYQSGSQPDANSPLPEDTFVGSWVFHGEIHPYDIQESESHYTQGGLLRLYSDGTFTIDIIMLSKSFYGGWYHMGGGDSRYRGTYTVENGCITLNYTGQYVSNHDDMGNWLGTELIPYEETEKLILTSLSKWTEADFGKYGICDLERISADPEYADEWVSYLLDLLTQMHP